jgi:hypothetical protein
MLRFYRSIDENLIITYLFFGIKLKTFILLFSKNVYLNSFIYIYICITLQVWY